MMMMNEPRAKHHLSYDCQQKASSHAQVFQSGIHREGLRIPKEWLKVVVKGHDDHFPHCFVDDLQLLEQTVAVKGEWVWIVYERGVMIIDPLRMNHWSYW